MKGAIMSSVKMKAFAILIVTWMSIAIMACGGGGGGGSNPTVTSALKTPLTPAPTLSVLPADFDFGIITNGNTVDTLEVNIRNTGTANLNVSDIALTGAEKENFNLNLNGGTNPCVSTSLTIASGSHCTMTVDFLPVGRDTYSADLTIQSNDPNTPIYDMSLLGSKEDITEANVKINQIEACPRPGLATVYVSVTDQGGFPIRSMDQTHFAITEEGIVKATTSAISVDDTVTLSVALLMDYSASIRMEPDNVTDMENAAISFVNQLGTNDEAEIVKYATDIEVTQTFTSNTTLLTNAIQSNPNLGPSTALYDAIVQAVTDISTRTRDRRAIIVITDGMDRDGSGNQLSINSIDDVIAKANARGVPVFTVGLGDADITILQQIANATGGTFSDSTTSDNLAKIYQQLADLLFTDQYILTYTSGLASIAAGDLSVTATYVPGISGTDTKSILACP
jgi:VWFA-related protein